jgi:hypothetical protein
VLVRCGCGNTVSQGNCLLRYDHGVGSVEHVFIMAIAIILMVAVTLIAAKAVGILSMDPTL